MKHQRLSLFAHLTLLCLFLLTMSAYAIDADKIRIDGQIRLRNEYDLKSQIKDRHSKAFHDLRTRLGVRADPTDWAFVYIQLQDSRRLGDTASGDLTSADNVDLHQVYFDINDIVFDGLSVRAGRFELNYGNQRVFGSVGWNNIGRSWDGGRISYRDKHVRVDGFSLKRREVNDEDYNRDFDIYGIYTMIDPAHLDLFWFYELDADSNGYVQERLKRHNIGFYYESGYHALDFVLQGNYQFGEQPLDTLPDVLVQDISAYMAYAEIGLSFYGTLPGRISAVVDYTSGDDTSDRNERDKHSAYANAYYTAHRFRGYMDYFVNSPEYGLIDYMFRGQVWPTIRWLLQADLHSFRAAELSKNIIRKKRIGTELDLTVECNSIRGVSLTGGASFFSPNPGYDYRRESEKTGVWMYLMTTVNF